MAKSYLSPESFEEFKNELRELLHNERPKVTQQVSDAAALGDRSENAEYIYGKKRLREIDRRIRFLQNKLENVEVTNDEDIPTHEVRFRTWVKLQSDEGDIKIFQIIGPDDMDTSGEKITFTSPLGRAILGKKAGDVFTFHAPKGKIEYEIVQLAKSKAEIK